MSGATYELCASTIVYGKAKNNFSVFSFLHNHSPFLNDYISDYIKVQTECQPLFAKIFVKIKISRKSVYHTHI